MLFILCIGGYVLYRRMITKEQVKKIAEVKMPDLNAAGIESAMSMVSGTARSMGVNVEGSSNE